MGRRVLFAVASALLVAYGCSSFDAESVTAPDAGPDDGGLESSVENDAAPPDASCSASLATDPKNCGACGHSCLGSTCSGGRCAPHRLAVTSEKATMIAPTSNGVHWIVRGGTTLLKCPPEGCNGAPAPLSSALTDAHGVIAVGEDLAVLCGGSIQNVTPNGGTTPIIGGFSNGSEIGLADDGFLYYRAVTTTTRILRVLRDGGSGTTIRDSNALDLLAVGGKHVVYVIGMPDSLAVCDDHADCSNGRLIHTFGIELVTKLAMTETDVFYSRRNELGKCAIDGGCLAGTTILHTEPDVEEVGVDATHFWYLRKATGELVRCLHAGCAGAPEVMAKTESTPDALLVTKDAVYWATGEPPVDGGAAGMSAVWRLVK